MNFLLLGLALFFLIFLVMVFGQIILSLMTIGFFYGPYYVGSDQIRIKNILSLAKLTKNDHLIDLGTGDGRIVIAAAQTGARATGIEINPIYYCRARHALKKHHLSPPQAQVIWGDFWEKDLSAYSVVVVYGIGYIMSRLAKKLQKELKPGTKVISVYFKFPDWQMLKQKGDIRYYQIPDSLPKKPIN